MLLKFIYIIVLFCCFSIVKKVEGVACTSDKDCLFPGSRYDYCGGLTTRCLVYSKINETCNPDFNILCESGLTCKNYNITTPKPFLRKHHHTRDKYRCEENYDSSYDNSSYDTSYNDASSNDASSNDASSN